MLNKRLDIIEVAPPFLLTMPEGSWHLVIRVEKISSDHYLCICINKDDDSFSEYTKDILEAPFHVAENIWELSYGVEIMTLLDDSMTNHPGRELWAQWSERHSSTS